MFEITKINGKSLKIRYDFKAIIELERVAKKSIAEIFVQDISGDNVKLESICMLVYAGLRFENQVKTLDEVVDLISGALDDGEKIEDIILPFMEAVEKSAFIKSLKPEEEESKAEEAKPLLT